MGDTSKTDAPRAQLHADPKQVSDYAQTCVQYVERNIGVPLDYTVETLPLLDHYLRQAREPGSERPEAAALVATVAGCYLGEVLRMRHDLTWNLQAKDPLGWSLTSASGALTVFPIALVQVALEGARSERNLEVFAFDKKIRDTLTARLDELPAVDEEQYVAPSTRVEVVDMAVDILTGMEQNARHECGCTGECDCKK